jgi:hypothetical protein
MVIWRNSSFIMPLFQFSHPEGLSLGAVRLFPYSAIRARRRREVKREGTVGRRLITPSVGFRRSHGQAPPAPFLLPRRDHPPPPLHHHLPPHHLLGDYDDYRYPSRLPACHPATPDIFQESPPPHLRHFVGHGHNGTDVPMPHCHPSRMWWHRWRSGLARRWTRRMCCLRRTSG